MKPLGFAGLLLAAMLAIWVLAWPMSRPRARSAADTRDPGAAEPGPSRAGSPRGARGRAASGRRRAVKVEDIPVELPRPGVRAQTRVLVRAKYGAGDDELGRSADAEERPPQSFFSTRDGKLVVLDSAKMRLVYYGADGSVERKLPLPPGVLALPADLAITAAGTIAVLDSPGASKPGVLLLDAWGNTKGMLPPSIRPITHLYAAGDELYAAVGGGASVKLADSSGAAAVETAIAGAVAPDGTTVLSADFDDRDEGAFRISAVQGVSGEELFTRAYRAPGVTEIVFLQADGAGNVYAVVRKSQQLELLCLDAETGTALGAVALPAPPSDGGKHHRSFGVAETGGLVYQQAGADGVVYEWFNCH